MEDMEHLNWHEKAALESYRKGVADSDSVWGYAFFSVSFILISMFLTTQVKHCGATQTCLERELTDKAVNCERYFPLWK